MRLFYHICTLPGYQKILQEQLDLINKSGLYNQLSKIHITIIGKYKSKTLKIIEQYDKKKKVYLEYHSNSYDDFEFPTLEAIHQFSLACKKDTKILYLHTKGVSFSKDRQMKNMKYAWREFMQEFLVNNFKNSIKALDAGLDTIGVYQDFHPTGYHYSGNFWWSKSSYIRRLPDITTVTEDLLGIKDPSPSSKYKLSRYICEKWLLLPETIRYKRSRVSWLNKLFYYIQEYLLNEQNKDREYFDINSSSKIGSFFNINSCPEREEAFMREYLSKT